MNARWLSSLGPRAWSRSVLPKRSARVNVECLEPRQLLTAIPEFALPDVNTTSATYGEIVSPRDYLGQVSAWYFGHAT